jgi:hypothetical protein
LSSVPEDSREKAFRPSFQHAEDASVEGLELISPAGWDKMGVISSCATACFTASVGFTK